MQCRIFHEGISLDYRVWKRIEIFLKIDEVEPAFIIYGRLDLSSNR